MRTKYLAFVLIIALVTLAFVPWPQPQAPQADIQAIQHPGNWACPECSSRERSEWATGRQVPALASGPQESVRAVTNWINPTGGNWNDPANWDNGLPSASVDPVITLDGTYTVILNANVAIANLVLGGASGTQTLSIPAYTLTINGTANVNTHGVISFSGGMISGNGIISILGTLNWSGGEFQGDGEINVGSGAALNLSGTSGKSINGWACSISGVATWTGTGVIYGYNDAQFVVQNGGLFNIQNDAWLDHSSGGVSTFYNYGTLRKSVGGAGASSDTDWILSNHGELRLEQGTLRLHQAVTNHGRVVVLGGLLDVYGAYTQQSGETLLNGGGLQSAQVLNIYGGVIGGVGTYTAAVTIYDHGTVSPGLPTGKLTFTGVYNGYSGSIVKIEIGGTAPGEYDVLKLNSASVLYGGMHVSLVDGFVPAIGDEFTVIEYPSSTGNLGYLFPTLPDGVVWRMFRESTALRLEVEKVDVGIGFSGGADPVAGETVSYTLAITNQGTTYAEWVILNGDWPEGTEGIGLEASQGSCGNPRDIIFYCDLGHIDLGATATVTITMRLDPALRGELALEVEAMTNEGDFDRRDNTARLRRTILAVTDLHLSGAVTPTQVLAGGMVTYTYEITNPGPSEAQGIVLTVTLPPQVSYQGFAPWGARLVNCVEEGQVIVCTFDPMDPGGGNGVAIWGKFDQQPGYFGKLVAPGEVISAEQPVANAKMVASPAAERIMQMFLPMLTR